MRSNRSDFQAAIEAQLWARGCVSGFERVGFATGNPESADLARSGKMPIWKPLPGSLIKNVLTRTLIKHKTSSWLTCLSGKYSGHTCHFSVLILAN